MKYILFVCTENSARSQMAEALFNFHNRNPEYAGISAGTEPAKAIKQGAVEAMKEKGIDISQKKPKKLDSGMVKKAARIFTMGCAKGCPVTPPGKTEDWDFEDPAGKPIGKYLEVRDEIERRVMKLVSEIQ
ncbi:MAG: arsenate reductase ArsC [Candidatus Micrarchaeota archaeon]|nr:arsenate reductase ArsC [Candidatus Micrarchaeota archaeon]